MSITVKARAIKEVFHRDNFYIISFAPTETNRDIQLNQWGNFSCSGDIGYITVDKEYELILEEGKVSKYGMSYIIKDVPSLKMENIADLSLAEKKDILMQCTSSERLADNILKVYPDYIERVLMDGEESIDTKPMHGIGKAYHHAYCRILNEKYKYFHFIHNEHIKPYEITITESKKLFDVWSNADEIIKQVEDNPYYVLIEICGRSFDRTDNLLKTARNDLIDSDIRCEAVVMDILKRNEVDGNTRLNGNVCYTVMRDEYNCGHFKDKIVGVCENSSRIYFDKPTKDLSLLATYMKECNIASFARTANKDCIPLSFDVEKYKTLDNGIELTDEQLHAIENFKNYRFTILTGAGGCGKTSSVLGIINVCKDLNLTTTLLAPTGSASLRLSETTHQEASTIHLKCLRDRTINTDVLICDETSMVDLDVFAMMLGCIDNPKIRIVLIGDKFQLASVSYGTVFADLISSDVIPTTSLTKVFRYGNSGIAYAGANTRQGKDFFNDDVVKNKNDHLNIINDWDFYERDTDEEITSTVVDLYGKLRKKGIKKNDILILSAYNKGDCGTYVINNLIQSAWNPPKANEKIFERKVPHFGKITFRVGDRVINTKNNYSALTYDAWNEIQQSNGTLTEDDMEKTVIYNGQRGDVVEIRDDIMIVKFDEQLIVFDKLLVYNLLLAYSISCHKSQGNEIPYVINVVSPSHNRLMTKNLMYVANTRAKKHHINVGSINAYKDALKVDDVLRRNTWLLDLLKENA
jgi:exodeoxyribonuclease V alpha subunit